MRQEITDSSRRRRLLGAGAAGVAAVFAAAPLASAHATPVTSSTNPTTPGGADSGAKAKAGATAAAVTPQYGTRKIRIGVKIKDGSYVPAGTTTGGTKLKIVESGPGFPEGPQTTECTTVPDPTHPADETYCDFSQVQAVLHARLRREAKARGLAVPNADPGVFGYYWTRPGDSVTITQETVNPNLVIDATPKTYGPCVTDTEPDYPQCGTDFADFVDPGQPPVAKDDTARDVQPASVTIDVLKNDTTLPGEPTSISKVGKPKHGTAVVVGGASPAAKTAVRAAAASTPMVKYTPAAGFVGTDTFTYTLSTPNGVSTARVTVTVVAPPTANDDSARTTSGNAVTVDVLANDVANGGTGLHVSAVGTPAHGSATISGGRIVYTPDSSFVGTDTFTYTVATSVGTATATVTVTVNAGLSATGAGHVPLMIELGALLVVAGGAVTVAGRRRSRAGA